MGRRPRILRNPHHHEPLEVVTADGRVVARFCAVCNKALPVPAAPPTASSSSQ